MRRSAKPAKAKVEAKLPAARKSPKSDGAKLLDLEKRLTDALKLKTEALKREPEARGQLRTRDRELGEALAQKNATSEILRVISGSPWDVQPVLDAMAESAARLCAAADAAILRLDGDLFH